MGDLIQRKPQILCTFDKPDAICQSGRIRPKTAIDDRNRQQGTLLVITHRLDTNSRRLGELSYRILIIIRCLFSYQHKLLDSVVRYSVYDTSKYHVEEAS